MSLRIALLGTGYMAGVHGKNLAALEGVSVVAVCGTSLDKAKEFSAKQLGGTTAAYADFAKMLASEKLDGVVVTLPPYAHSGQVELAAANGLHLLIEKPIALTVERAESQVAACQKAGIVTQVGYHLRFSPIIARLRELIASGEAGRPTLFNAQYFCNNLHGPWWRDVRKSGGQVFEQCIHLYDMALHLFGPVNKAVGELANLTHTHLPDYTVEDTSASLLTFKNGAIGSIVASNCAIPWSWDNTFTAIFANLTVKFFSASKAELTFTKNGEPKSELIETTENPYALLAKDWVDAIRENRKTIAPIEDGLASLKLVAKVVGRY